MSKIQEKLKAFQEDMEATKKLRENVVAKLNELNVRVEQLNGAIFALKEVESAEAAVQDSKPEGQ